MSEKLVTNKMRDPEALNSEILKVARKLFAEKIFDQVRLEDIATKTESSVAHIMRSFGSKEELFLHAIDQQFKLWEMLQADRADMGRHLSRFVTAPLTDISQIQHVLLFVKGSLHNASRKVISKKLDEQFIGPYSKWIGGEDAEVRASLLSAFLFGLTFFHYLSDCPSFRGPNVKKIQEIAAPIFQELIDAKMSGS